MNRCVGKSGGDDVAPRKSTGTSVADRRARYILLGSSGECLPINRKTQFIDVRARRVMGDSESIYSSCDSKSSDDDDVYHSARDSFDDSIECNYMI